MRDGGAPGRGSAAVRVAGLARGVWQRGRPSPLMSLKPGIACLFVCLLLLPAASAAWSSQAGSACFQRLQAPSALSAAITSRNWR